MKFATLLTCWYEEDWFVLSRLFYPKGNTLGTKFAIDQPYILKCFLCEPWICASGTYA